MSGLLWLIPCLPLAGFLVNLFARLPKPLAAIVGCAGPIASFALSVAAFAQLPVEQQVFDWIKVGAGPGALSVPFGLRVDGLTGVMILVVTGVGSLIHVYSVAYMQDDDGFARFFAYLNLFMFSMLVLVMGDSLVLMFLGWEGVGLCSYLLIGFWYKELKNADAGKKAFIVNRVGDLGFVLGIFCVWQLFGTLDFAKMGGMPVNQESLAFWGAVFLFVGACGKSAQIPLFVWLPDAMAGPTPVSALIHAATMVTAGIYMVGRMHFLFAASGMLHVLGGVAAATALLAGVIAVAQNDIKKVLAYSTVSQLGFMFAGMASAQFTTGIFHVVTHAFFKALLFLGAGAVIHALHGEQDIRKMGGLARKLPGLAVVFIAGGLALAGMPLTAGYVSKDAILAATYAAHTGPSLVWVTLAATAFITAFYTTRLILVVFMPRPGEHHGDPHHEIHKPGILMMAPLAILAVLSLAGGLLLEKPLAHLLGNVWGTEARVHELAMRLQGGSEFDRAKAFIALEKMGPGVEEYLETRHLEGLLKQAHHVHSLNQGLSIVLFFGGFLSAFYLYGRGRETLKGFVEGPGRRLHSLVENKFYVDEIYEYLVVAPVRMGATVVWFLVDRLLIDTLLVGGAGKIVYGAGWVFRRPHTGSVNVAIGSFMVGALAMLAWMVFRFTR